MLDTEYIDRLFKELPVERKRELQIKLFGDTKQSMNYFRKIKDPGLSKLEILADFFDLPIDSLRLNSKFRRNPYIGVSDQKGNENVKSMAKPGVNTDRYDLFISKLIEAIGNNENNSLLKAVANAILDNLNQKH